MSNILYFNVSGSKPKVAAATSLPCAFFSVI